MKKVFVQDNDCHWYLIPVENKKEFEQWIDDVYEEKEYTHNYNDYRIDGSPSMYSVENVKEL